MNFCRGHTCPSQPTWEPVSTHHPRPEGSKGRNSRAGAGQLYLCSAVPFQVTAEAPQPAHSHVPHRVIPVQHPGVCPHWHSSGTCEGGGFGRGREHGHDLPPQGGERQRRAHVQGHHRQRHAGGHPHSTEGATAAEVGGRGQVKGIGCVEGRFRPFRRPRSKQEK